MSVKVVLPGGEYPQTGLGTRVFNDDGSEISDVVSVDIHMTADGLIEATMRVIVSGIERAADEGSSDDD